MGCSTQLSAPSTVSELYSESSKIIQTSPSYEFSYEKPEFEIYLLRTSHPFQFLELIDFQNSFGYAKYFYEELQRNEFTSLRFVRCHITFSVPVQIRQFVIHEEINRYPMWGLTACGNNFEFTKSWKFKIMRD
ncbi:hypothetical protein LOAG_04937 [Loa loa]|uniref:Uncharacterized protein n=1 Tax=Loa loa TaxID=7209 RepID=A0A1S0U1B6_LOALO|nr:hypothetical protein LOAG_04937 [Loa loa]EFO23551.1 hypothetical protein LOAG_04937 [Loa loa]